MSKKTGCSVGVFEQEDTAHSFHTQTSKRLQMGYRLQNYRRLIVHNAHA